MDLITPVILSGGSGTRLWPLSRETHPKQFINLVNENSLLGDTVERVEALDDVQHLIVVSNEEHRFMVAGCLQTHNNLSKSSIILEPVGRNTAPAIAQGMELASQHQCRIERGQRAHNLKT